MSRQKLSEVLKHEGFFAVLGTTEGFGVVSTREVGLGRPYSFDTREGIAVVCDEDGKPWITRARHVFFEFDGFWYFLKGLEEHIGYPLSYGAYVPHSHDGGAALLGLEAGTGIPVPEILEDLPNQPLDAGLFI